MTSPKRDEARGSERGLQEGAAGKNFSAEYEPLRTERAIGKATVGQNRKAPAYQEYAAAMLASFEFRAMTLAERGLFQTLRYECWVNCVVPADPAVLAKVIGFPAEEVAAALPALMPFFEATERATLRCPELDNYRAYLEDRNERQRAGGRKGAGITNDRRRDLAVSNPDTATPSATTPGKASGKAATTPPGSVRVLSTAQYSPAMEAMVTTSKERGGGDPFPAAIGGGAF